MADYYCWPIWPVDGDSVGCIDPSSLGLSKFLVEDIDKWAKVFDFHLNDADPAKSRWLESEISEFNRHGFRLAERICQELGNIYIITYVPIGPGMA